MLLFNPPEVYGHIWDRFSRPGFWELLTLAEFAAGDHASEERMLDAPIDTPVAQLTGWVTGLLGYPVALEEDSTAIRLRQLFARWHEVPLYWVRRDT